METAYQNSKHWLVFRLGDCVMCASALDVESIIQRPEAMVKFPGMPDYAMGAFLFRDRSAAAISLRRKLKVQHGEDCASGPFIVTRVRNALVAFWVDEVKDVIEEKDADWRPMPAMLEGGLFERFAVRERELILQTNFAALLEAKVGFESLATLAGTHALAAVVPHASVRPPEASRTQAAPRLAPEETHGEPEGLLEERLPELDSAKPDFTPPPPVSVAPPSRPPKVSRRIDTKRHTRPNAPHPLAVARATVPVRDPSKVTVAVTSRDGSEAGREAPSLRYWLAAAGVAVVAIAVILYGRPGPSRDVFSAPASFPRVDVPPERAQIALIQADTVKATLDSPATHQAAANPEGKPAAGGSSTAEATASPARVHVVVRGDTLWDIAKKHVGDASQYPELAKVSSIRNPHRIHPGDVVRIEVREPK